MAKEKSLVEEAIIQMKNLEEAVAENAKGILASTMKEEIKELVKESLSEQEEEDAEVETDVETDVEMEEPETEEPEMDDEEEGDDMETDNEDEDMSMDSMDTIDLRGKSHDQVLRVFELMDPEDKIVVTKDGAGNINLKDNESNKEYMIVQEGEEYEEEMFEMWDDDKETSIDDIVSKVFDNKDEEEMNEMEDELYGDSEEMDDEEMEETIYEISMDSMDSEEEMDEMDSEEMMEDEMDDEDEMEEPIYEISFGDEEEGEEEEDMEMDFEDEDYMMESKMKKSMKPKGVGIGKGPKKDIYSKNPNTSGGFKVIKKKADKTMGTGNAKKGFSYDLKGENLDGEFKIKPKKMETKEASRTYGSGSNFRRGGLPKPKAHSKFNSAIQESEPQRELQVLREKNEEYRKALNIFRNKLNEVAVFNSNLAYATRLFTEHSTSKQEKINILRRFDGVETIKESKNLYKSIKDELSSTTSQPMNESIERVIEKAPSTGSASNLIESKTYENPQFMRMKDLMTKLR